MRSIWSGTAVKAHRHSAGARRELGPQAIGTSRGGRGTKIHAACDALGYPLAVKLTAANEKVTSPKPKGSGRTSLLSVWLPLQDYDSDALREPITFQGAEPVIPPRKHRQEKRPYDEPCYGSRHVVENFFCRIKAHRRVATRYEKTASMFAAMVMISCILVWLKF